MTLQQLKNQIENNILSDDLLILVCEENHFIAQQYVEAICKYKGCDIIKINSIYEPLTSSLSLVIDYENNLNVLVTETFEERAEDYTQFSNTIVICEKIDKKLEPFLKDFIVKIPKLEDWCIKDYVKTLCPKLDQESIDWLYTMTRGDIYRILNEVDKLTLFSQDEQALVLNALRYDPNTDLYTLKDIFTFASILTQRNKVAILDYLKHSKVCTFDPIAVVSLVLQKMRAYIYKMPDCKNLNLKELGLAGQAYYAELDLRGTPQAKLLPMIDFLSKIDLRLKSSELDMSSEELLDYVICHLFSF